MSASNSLAGPLRRLSTHLLGGSLKKVSKAVAEKEGEKDVYCDDPAWHCQAASMVQKHATPGLDFQTAYK